MSLIIPRGRETPSRNITAMVMTQITSTGLKGARKVMKSWGRATAIKVHMRKHMKDGPRRSLETLLCVSMG